MHHRIDLARPARRRRAADPLERGRSSPSLLGLGARPGPRRVPARSSSWSPSSSRSSATSSPTPSSPAATASARRRSSCGRSAAWPASTASRARRGPTGWIAAAGPLASLAIGVVAFGAAFGSAASARPTPSSRCSAGSASSTSPSACSTCCPAPRSTAAASCGRCAGRMHGNRYRAMREAGQAGRVIGWALGALGLGADARPADAGLWLALTGRVHRHQRPRRDRLRRRRRAARRRHGRRPDVVRRRRDRHRHGRRLDDLAALSASAAPARSPCAATTASSTGSCSRTSCGPCPSSSGRG